MTDNIQGRITQNNYLMSTTCLRYREVYFFREPLNSIIIITTRLLRISFKVNVGWHRLYLGEGKHDEEICLVVLSATLGNPMTQLGLGSLRLPIRDRY